VRETEPLEQLADAALVVLDAEARGDHVPEVEAPPAHHFVRLRIGTGLHDLRKLGQLRGGQANFRAFVLAIDQPVRPFGVETMNPVAQRLTVHAADLRSLRPILALANRRQRQKPPALVGVLRSLREPSQLQCRIVFPKMHRPRHGSPPWRLESAIMRFGKPLRVRAQGLWYNATTGRSQIAVNIELIRIRLKDPFGHFVASRTYSAASHTQECG